jgi:alkanesulfonate monooxygenase SsuD/methylene tetrahydromethanopterin reductase-like flavin-dependent oxidoreductase (luciferase family)
VTGVRVGAGPSTGGFRDTADAEAFVRAAAEHGLDHVFSADHVSFRDGMGIDGLVQLAWVLGRHPTLRAYCGVFLLALRHPTVVARQVATIAQLAPGRLVLGVGVGGEDPHEFEAVDVSPRTRGRRTDEALDVLRAMLAGEAVTHHGEFFHLDDVRVRPAPSPPVPIVIGGRSDAALRRAARRGDGWLGVWCSPARFAAAIAEVEAEATRAGRADVAWDHGMQIWAGIDRDRDAGRIRLAAAMERTYGVPFERFERYSPYGPPEEVADFLAGYVDAGCSTFNIAPVTDHSAEGVADVGEVRRLLLSRY